MDGNLVKLLLLYYKVVLWDVVYLVCIAGYCPYLALISSHWRAYSTAPWIVCRRTIPEWNRLSAAAADAVSPTIQDEQISITPGMSLVALFGILFFTYSYVIPAIQVFHP